MRIGQNPAKAMREVTKPARVTVAVLNYIPFLNGFYAEMLDVLKACLGSIWENTGEGYDLLVFDNASCEEVRQYLLDEHQAGRIQYLFLSEKNIGKGGAWNVILAGAPGEVISYADNDCLFFPGWLERSLQILDTYPKVGMVTARPFRTRPALYTNTVAWGEQESEAKIERGNFIPYDVFREFDLSLGQSEEEIRTHYETSEDIRLEYHGVPAIVGASHWQFTASKEVLKQFLPFNMDWPMGQVRQLDQRMNDAGYLRLMPVDPLAMNMSNTLHNLAKVGSPAESPRPAAHRLLLDFPPVRRSLLYLYDKIFRWYYYR